mgnify:CR=1 FL=1
MLESISLLFLANTHAEQMMYAIVSYNLNETSNNSETIIADSTEMRSETKN